MAEETSGSEEKNGTENASEKTEAAEAADTEDTAEAAGPEDDDSGKRLRMMRKRAGQLDSCCPFSFMNKKYYGEGNKE